MKYLVKDNKSFEDITQNLEFYSKDNIVKIGNVGESALYRFCKEVVPATADITVNANSNYFYFVDLFSATDNTIQNVIDLKLSWASGGKFFGRGYMTAPDSKGMAIIGYYIDVSEGRYRLVVAFRNTSTNAYVISGGLPKLFISVDYV